jgi:DNA-binding response OmpR family regulator
VDLAYEKLVIECEALRQRVAELEAIISGDSVRYQGLGITARDARLLGALMSREALTHAEINIIVTDDAMDAGGGIALDVGRQIINRLKRKLQAHDSRIRIASVWGAGYRLAPDTKKLIDSLKDAS